MPGGLTHTRSQVAKAAQREEERECGLQLVREDVIPTVLCGRGVFKQRMLAEELDLIL